MSTKLENQFSEQAQEIQKLHEAIAAQKVASEITLQKMKDTQLEINRQVDAYALEIAARRGYERTVGLVLTVSAALAIGIGVLFAFLGLDELDKIESKVAQFDTNADAIEARLDEEITTFKAELDVTIDDKIALFFNRNEAKSNKYKQNVDDMRRLIDVLAQAEGRWAEIKPALEGLENYDPDADLKGDFLAIIEADQQTELDISDSTRAEQVGIVLRVSSHLRNAEDDPDFTLQFTPDDIFNAAQIARGLQRPDLENELVNAAYNLDRSDLSVLALFLQLQARYGPIEERNMRYSELIGLLNELTMDSPHIVIAEAWNAAEGMRRYTEFISALDQRISSAKEDSSLLLPSHAFAIKGNAHQRRGLPGELQVALESYIQAIDRLAMEGTHTQWAEATIRNTLQGVQQLILSGIDVSPIVEAAGRSGIIPLQENLNGLVFLSQLSSENDSTLEGTNDPIMQIIEQMMESQP
ncbi:hypothetical protein [Salipiger sp. PrR002]|uniref:hypothetical protein n=1 Tax=Salipiger sp. PrR002 TaxID=2706489 RepID=UPI0013BC295E|nr:hypothetical protein [Salipiger sp. PrR002]NDW02775.1 hypothetical protein [Salipiger sp. PrR002]NDW60063.1 hypothetical protein [Salipiger sp. PrR004]